MSELRGYTVTELIQSSRRLAIELKAGHYPDGFKPRDFRIYGDLAVYCPYIPLQVIPPIKTENNNYDDR